jgi:hypothetical protein
MKTKYSALIKIKQNKIQELEAHLGGLNALIVAQQDLIDKAKQSILSLTKPKSGNFKEFINNQDIMIVQKIDQNLKLTRKIELEDEKKWILNKLKETNIELEKIKYLHNLEINKKQKEIKQKEDNLMNEISTILYNNKNAS